MKIEKSVDGVLGIQTQGRRMVGADETTELWRPPSKSHFKVGYKRHLVVYFSFSFITVTVGTA